MKLTCGDQKLIRSRMQLSGDNLAGYFALPRAGFPAWQRKLRGMSAYVVNLLPLGLGSSVMIILGFEKSTGFMCGA
jgi:hypothetical protein